MSDAKFRRGNAVTPLGDDARLPSDDSVRVGMVNEGFETIEMKGPCDNLATKCENMTKSDEKVEKSIKQQNGSLGTDTENTDKYEEVMINKDGKLLHYCIPEKLTFYEAMGPMIKTMKVFGLWHEHQIEPRYYKSGFRQFDTEKTKIKKIFNLRNYCIFVMVILWFNFIRSIPAFVTGPEQAMDPKRLFFKVIYLLFTFQCACNATTLFVASDRMDKMPRFFHHWEDRIQSSAETGIDLKRVRRWSIVLTVSAIIFITFHFLNQGLSVYGPLESMRNASQVFVAPFPDNKVLHLVILIIDVYDFAAWIFPIFYFIQISMIMCNRFGEFTKRLHNAILKTYCTKGLPLNFEQSRYQHQELCLAVEHSNKGLFTYINAIAYGTMLPLACFLLYQLLFSDTHQGNVSALLMYVVWLASIFVNVPVVSWTAAIVNTRAHECLNLIYNVRVKSIGNDEQMMMNMFLSRLNGHPVGYTVFDLVTLTKPFILTMGGLGVTYFALLAEFEHK